MEPRKTSNVPFPQPVWGLLQALSSAGFFEESILIGNWVMPLYSEFFDIAYALRTMDIDFAVQFLRGKKAGRRDLQELILSLGFTPLFTESGVQKFSREGLTIGFTANRPGGRREDRVLVSEWNITAVLLPFVNILFGFSFAAECGGTKVRAPIPEAFFLHKLLTAAERQEEGKRLKDLEQCRVIAPKLNRTRLHNVCGSVKLSSRTKGDIRLSCKSIGFPPHMLGI